MNASKSRPAKPLSPDDHLPGLDEVMVVAKQGLGDLALTDFRVGQTQMTGMPSGVLIR